ncbi:MAG: tetratricopeptide repeat protein [Bacteroidales bacterium]|jgi:outer membrane protein assembly factor BamD (BamD/ComL family)
METKKIISVIAIAAIIIAGCGPSKQKKINEIKILEDKIKTSDIKNDKQLVNDYIVACKDYCRRFPDDSLSPKYLFGLAVVSMTIGNSQDAIGFLDEVCKKYPNSARVADALLQKAILYDTQLNNTKTAGILYHEFITKYPNDKNVQVAKDALSVLGKSPEEVLNSFKKDSTNVK